MGIQIKRRYTIYGDGETNTYYPPAGPHSTSMDMPLLAVVESIVTLLFISYQLL